MFRRGIFLLIAAALVGCVVLVVANLRTPAFFPASFQTALGECPEMEDYPAQRRAILDPEETEWFGRQLADFDEPPIAWGIASEKPTLRFMLLRYRSPIVVRVTETDGGRMHLTAKWPYRSAGCAQQSGCGVDKFLSPAERARLEGAVEPFLRAPSYGCWGPPDSGAFVLEWRDGDIYRKWHQRSPRSGDMSAAGNVFLELAEWPLFVDLT